MQHDHQYFMVCDRLHYMCNGVSGPICDVVPLLNGTAFVRLELQFLSLSFKCHTRTVLKGCAF